MSTNAERQRARRNRLRQQGIVDVTVAVPQQDATKIRQFAKQLRDDPGGPAASLRLLHVIKALKSIREELGTLGVIHAGLFGSTARGEDREDSDIDIIIEIDTDRVGDVLELVKIAERIRDAIAACCPDASVDVADSATLRPGIRKAAEQEAIYAY